MDSKLKPLLDVPGDSKRPGLNFQEYAEALAGLLANADPPQLTVGLFGGYGSGKTTLMNAVYERLSETDFIKINFSAWRHDHEEHLFLPFLCALNRNTDIKKDPKLTERLQAAGRGFVRGLDFKFKCAPFNAWDVSRGPCAGMPIMSLDGETPGLRPSIVRGTTKSIANS